MNKYSYVIYTLVLSSPYSCTFSSFLHLAVSASAMLRVFRTCSMAPSSTSSTSRSPTFTFYSFPLHLLTSILFLHLIFLHLLLSFSSASFFLVQCTNWHISAFIVWADGITSGVLLKYHDEWKSWCDLHIHLWCNEGSLVLRRKWRAVVFRDWNVTSEYYPTVFPFKLYYNFVLCQDLSISLNMQQDISRNHVKPAASIFL